MNEYYLLCIHLYAFRFFFKFNVTQGLITIITRLKKTHMLSLLNASSEEHDNVAECNVLVYSVAISYSQGSFASMPRVLAVHCSGSSQLYYED